MSATRILRACSLCAALFFAASLPCFASATQLNLKASAANTELPDTSANMKGGSVELPVFNSSGGIVSEISVTFTFGPFASCDGDNGDVDETTCSFGRGGSIDIVVRNAFGIQTASYNGTLLDGFFFREFDDGNTVERWAAARFVLDGFNGVGAVFVDEDGGDDGLDSGSINFVGTATPEPGTLALLGTGLLGLVPLMRRQRPKTNASGLKT